MVGHRVSVVLFRWMATVVFGAALYALTPAPAGAADLSDLWSPADQGQLPVVEYTTTWYLRGDVGYGSQRAGSVFALPITGAVSLNGATNLGGGFGARWRWFRVDLTLDYGQWAKVTDPAGYTARFTTFTTLANAYLDLGNWFGVTPYVGGGVGFSWNRLSAYTTPLVMGLSGSTTNFAWAAMAGVSYQFSQNWLVDLGYRHLAFGRALAQDLSTVPVTTLSLSGLAVDEVRVGLRFNIN